MCYSGKCPYERGDSGECRGSRDWDKADAECRRYAMADEYEYFHGRMPTEGELTEYIKSKDK